MFPLIITVVLAVVQGALWAHAGAIAQAAADHGVEVAAALGSSDAAGEAAALDFAGNAGTIRNVGVEVANDDGSEFVEMTVNGTYPTVFGMRTVTATAVTVRERLPD